MRSHFMSTLVPTGKPVVAGEVASREQVAVDGPLKETVIVLPTAPSPTAETVPRTCTGRTGFGAGFGFGHVGPAITARTAVELPAPIIPPVKPVAGSNVALRLPSTRA